MFINKVSVLLLCFSVRTRVYCTQSLWLLQGAFKSIGNVFYIIWSDSDEVWL